VSAYPRALFPGSYCAQTGPSEGASRGVVKRGGEVAAHGCNTRTQRAAAEAASSRRHRALWRQRCDSVPNDQALPGSKAVVRNLSHRGSCRTKPQTPRPGRWRKGGLAGFFRNFPRICWTSRRPARARTFFECASAEWLRMQSASRERWRLF